MLQMCKSLFIWCDKFTLFLKLQAESIRAASKGCRPLSLWKYERLIMKLKSCIVRKYRHWLSTIYFGQCSCWLCKLSCVGSRKVVKVKDCCEKCRWTYNILFTLVYKVKNHCVFITLELAIYIYIRIMAFSVDSAMFLL